MIVAVVALALLASLLGGGMVAGFAWGRNAIIQLGIAQEEKLASDRKAMDLEEQRDEELGLRKKAEAECVAAKAALGTQEAAARKARDALTSFVKEHVATGSDDALAAEVDRLLGTTL